MLIASNAFWLVGAVKDMNFACNSFNNVGVGPTMDRLGTIRARLNCQGSIRLNLGR